MYTNIGSIYVISFLCNLYLGDLWHEISMSVIICVLKIKTNAFSVVYEIFAILALKFLWTVIES